MGVIFVPRKALHKIEVNQILEKADQWVGKFQQMLREEVKNVLKNNPSAIILLENLDYIEVEPLQETAIAMASMECIDSHLRLFTYDEEK